MYSGLHLRDRVELSPREGTAGGGPWMSNIAVVSSSNSCTGRFPFKDNTSSKFPSRIPSERRSEDIVSHCHKRKRANLRKTSIKIKNKKKL